MQTFCLMVCLCYFFLASINDVVSLVSDFKIEKREVTGVEIVPGLAIHEMTVNSQISNRYAQTVVTSKIVNTAAISQIYSYTVFIPKNAFVTEFVMEVASKNYTSFVIDNKEARMQFDSTCVNGLGSRNVSARDSKAFPVPVNVEPNSHITCYLSYQELLRKKQYRYENVINVTPGQLVENLRAQVSISEEGKLRNLKVLFKYLNGNKIESEIFTANVTIISNSSSLITYFPTAEAQKRFARWTNTDEKNGLTVQFVVQYDVKQDQDADGEMLVKDGYFVNFLAPIEFQPFSSSMFVVFVLDASTSMAGNKVQQAFKVILAILDQLDENDRFSVIVFSGTPYVWDLDRSTYIGYTEPQNLNEINFPSAFPVTASYISTLNTMFYPDSSFGSTNILHSLEVGLNLVELEKLNIDNILGNGPVRMVLLTDGKPTRGDVSTNSITEKITAINTGLKKSSIYTFSFGDDANQEFLRNLSLQNNGIFKHIHESSDYAKELENFRDDIPVWSNVSFTFNPTQVSNLTKTHFLGLYKESEIVVGGQCGISKIVDPPEISAMSSDGLVKMRPVVRSSLGDISRLWAFLTVNELLENRKISNSNSSELDQKVVDLAINNSFVTDLTSMVITSPRGSSVIGTDEIEDALCSKLRRKPIGG